MLTEEQFHPFSEPCVIVLKISLFSAELTTGLKIIFILLKLRFDLLHALSINAVTFSQTLRVVLILEEFGNLSNYLGVL